MHDAIKKSSSLSNRQLASTLLGVSQADQLPDSAHLRPKACALLMGVSIATFWRLVASGKLKTHKLTARTTSVTMKELRAFMAGNVEG